MTPPEPTNCGSAPGSDRQIANRAPAGRMVAALIALGMTTRAPMPPRSAMPPYQTFTIDSRAVAERRTINVYTPPEYSAHPTAGFPVLYMPDGGVAEDFPHVVTTIDSLIRLERIPPLLVVGIENTERRRDMTGPTTVGTDSAIARRVGGSAAFRGFIRDELMPEVRKRYHTTEETSIVGESLAGLFVVETFLLEPTVFRRYIALSPSLWWNHGALLQSLDRRLDAQTGLHRTIYLTAATEPGIGAETASLAAALEARAPADLTWFYEPRPDLAHGTIFLGVAPGAFAKVLK
ncbi:MAG: alpha/beta hydrolase-fold protein [Gemmatimonadota bacterium]